MQFLLHIATAKNANFQKKFGYGNRNQKLCHVICIFFRYFLGKYNCAKFNHCGIYVTDFMIGGT